MKIVVTDHTIVSAGGVSWAEMEKLGDLVLYDNTMPEELIDRIKDATAVFSNRVKIPAEAIEAAPQLKMIGVFGTGIDNVDAKCAKEHGVAVCNVPGYGRGAVAQMAIALMMEIARNTAFFNSYIKNVGWTDPIDLTLCNTRTIEMTGKTFGIIGMGDIGYAAARIAMAMDMNVLAYRRNPKPELECDQLHFADLDTVLRESDVISIHCPLTPETEGLINKDTIAKMKDGVIFINVSRGKIMVQDDVADALDSGKIYAAGIDTFFPEPCGKDHRLALHPRCIATPHVGWSPLETKQRVVNTCAANLKSVLDGNPQNVANK